ncbi:penicillin acylase family protein [Caballeronia sp. LZ065]|uniref:penicillin acylase family protein n=1 Tax=Caballeronia sp. LZ065 TaxID=3038571 RepID=UPI0028563289|nr:penicillin acylase family protein [Caballeronia sp. LZ065]MDR5782371.1 penicillin acylase family protein [Caballeronia sp. LZ065]
MKEASTPWLTLAVSLTLCAGLAACAAHREEAAAARDPARDQPPSTPAYRAEITRAPDGVPHIVANDWGSLGWGAAYAQAADNLCTLAAAFVTYRGERSRWFGADARQPTASTLGDIGNLDSDFYFRLVDDTAKVQAYRAAQPPAIREMVDGFAAGYNRYVRDWRSGAAAPANAACRGAGWVGEIDADDVYRRLFAANLAGGEARFAARIANARPPSAGKPDSASAPPAKGVQHSDGTAAATLAGVTRAVAGESLAVGGGHGIGSNALAFGAEGSSDGHAVLLGNPHWFLEGPDKFYQMRLSLPGKLDVSGVAMLGVPVVMIGFNRDVAWTHTVSAARRFGVFQLTLADDSPTTYLRDGQRVAMTPVPIAVQARAPDGTLTTVRRTLYRSAFGPIADLSGYSPAMRWQDRQAFAIRDINAANYRVFENFLAWGRARSLDEFRAIQTREAAVPWVNTVAIGRDDPRVWYADIGAVPNVPDALAAACTTPIGHAFAAGAPGVPFLDGSRTACDWRTDQGSPQPGAMPADRQPQLLRRDFVANMNNSHWLANPAQPLTGYAAVTGAERSDLGLRARLGLRMAQQRIAGTDGLPGRGANPATLRSMALDSRSMSATLYKRDALDAACNAVSADAAGRREVRVDRDPAGGEDIAARDIDIAPACRVLRDWNDTARADARGATLWDAWWTRIDTLPDAARAAVPFDAARPLDTPAGLKVDGATLARMLAVAVLRIEQGGFAIDAERADTLFVRRNGVRIGLFGGCDGDGYFTAACSERRIETGGKVLDAHANANTYLQVVSFGADGAVDAKTLMAAAQSDDPASPRYGDGLLRYADQEWSTQSFDASDAGAPLVVDARSATSAVAPASLAERWTALRERLPSREAAQWLDTPEAALVATEAGRDVVRLRASPRDIDALLAHVQTLGKLEVMVRTDSGISERTVDATTPYFDRRGRPLHVAARDPQQLDLRPDPGVWKEAFAVTRYYGPSREPYRQLQFFDGAGHNVAKIHVVDDARAGAYAAFVSTYRADDQSAEFHPDATLEHAEHAALPALQSVALRSAVPRCTAQARGPDARLAALAWLNAALDAHLPLASRVANDGAVQSHAARLTRVHDIGDGWLSVQSRNFALHLRVSDIVLAQAGADDAITFSDRAGVALARFAPAPQATARERGVWRARLASTLTDTHGMPASCRTE